jgi:TonB family protein
MSSGLETPSTEVFVLPPRILKNDVLFVLFVTLGFVISMLVTTSPYAGTQQGHLVAQRSPQPNALGLDVLSPTEDMELGPYLQSLYIPVRRNFLANIPESAVRGTKGLVVIRFQLQRDGTLSDKAMTFVARSGKKDMNEAALNAIRMAAPFQRLPQGYAGTNLDLQFSFYYNSGPEGSVQESKQKPGVVPIGTAVNQGMSVLRQCGDFHQWNYHEFNGQARLSDSRRLISLKMTTRFVLATLLCENSLDGTP